MNPYKVKWLANELLKEAWATKKVPEEWVELMKRPTAAEAERAKAVTMVNLAGR
jgi:hypothetical protein